MMYDGLQGAATWELVHSDLVFSDVAFIDIHIYG